ncbi:uncharacterized protein BDZ99DRAFT_575434 [Mytilinidion resinicola]|uniref:Uncharacterized protein n=1 Tax=Mytilinidion resinicola TaxID=574789 RepID=A0A6A6Y932_9PEZI|nr:uncharacterized protein BDZ99DRAFT_575434 [Mytilinidion resinicola]KAF2804474.1 hypothetical protein BDZ99DRAFT_575434 [Mytilinidion resinicola]
MPVCGRTIQLLTMHSDHVHTDDLYLAGAQGRVAARQAACRSRRTERLLSETSDMADGRLWLWLTLRPPRNFFYGLARPLEAILQPTPTHNRSPASESPVPTPPDPCNSLQVPALCVCDKVSDMFA